MQRIFVFICLAGWAAAAIAQTDKSSWQNLSGIKPGQEIQITDAASKKHPGIFTGVTATAIALTTSAGQQSVEKENVRTVKLIKPNRRARHTLIGAGVGAAAGAALFGAAWAADPWGKNNAGVTAAAAGIGAVFCAPIGALVGLALPTHGSTTVYDSGSH